jgi:RNase adaptor protein for sRNA GlmZ degradation
MTTKGKLNQSFRTRISLLLKKRHEKQQHIQNCVDEESDQQQHQDERVELDAKKVTLSQRFDTFRRSFHLGKHNSASKSKGHLLLNE